MKSRFIREQKTICGKEYMEVDLLHVSPAEHRASVREKKAFASSLGNAELQRTLRPAAICIGPWRRILPREKIKPSWCT